MWEAVLCIVAFIAGLYSLDISSTSHPVLTNKNVSRHCHISPGEKNHSQLRSTVLDVGDAMNTLSSLLSTIPYSEVRRDPLNS